MTAAVAVVTGVGSGLGWALVRRFAQEGLTVFASARNLDKLKAMHAAEPLPGVHLQACDVTDRAQVEALFAAADGAGTLVLSAANAGTFRMKPVLELDPADFEADWRLMCLGALHIAQAAGRRLVANGSGTLLFTGATAALRGGANFSALAVPKFGLRALCQSLARELGPKNVHVAHVIVDGLIRGERTDGMGGEKGPDGRLEPDAIADSYWHLHTQHRSAWTQELDLRPWTEKF